MTLTERIFSVTIFPLVMAASVAAGLVLLPSAERPEIVAGGIVFASGLLVFGLERVFPLYPSWLHSKGDLKPDLAYFVLVGNFISAVVSPLAVALGVASLGWLSERFGPSLWPTQWSLLAQLPLALVVAELPKYWHHRLQHNVDFLWRFHATHHSAPRLYWLNAARFHPVDLTVDTLLGGVTLVALGASTPLLALFLLVSGVHGFFQHANLKLHLGPLNYFFSMAELHRWHHSKTILEANHNYGQNVIVWDLVFGSFFWPKDREPPEDIGIPDLPAFPMTFWQQLVSPITWHRIRAQSATTTPHA